MKKKILKAFGIGAVLLVAAVVSVPSPIAPVPQEPVDQMLTPRPLPEFIATLMEVCGGSKHSPAKRAILSSQIERAATRYLKGTDQHSFAALICLETRMGSIPRATSSAGARGVAQLMVATAKAEAARCGFGGINDDDLYDNEINLNIAACHYAKLVEDVGPAIAAAAYNSGAASDAVKALQRLVPSKNSETMAYAALVGVILTQYLHSEPTKKAAP